jgi:23S rRNA (adenine1618-N6)-methyltransferase
VQKDKKNQVEKPVLHSQNKHRERYDFQQLIATHSDLGQYVIQTEFDQQSIDFFNPKAVIALNTALLKFHYGLEYWEIPAKYLCPPVPGRADYIHYLADLLNYQNNKNPIKCLDIGTGANCIYPLIGNREYGWQFVATDIDKKAIESAQHILDKNEKLSLNSFITLKLQKNKSAFFEGIIQPTDYFDSTMCNPPFHESAQQAAQGANRKVRNLKKTQIKTVTLNFGGQANELWCEGGERQFLKNMITESIQFANNVGWFTSLVSKQENVIPSIELIKKIGAKKSKIVPMAQGNKKSRFIAWRF